MKNKRIIIICLVFLIIFNTMNISFVSAEGYDRREIIINDTKVDSSITTEVVNEITYVKLTAIQKQLQMNIVLDNNYVYIKYNNNSLVINCSNNSALLNGATIELYYPIIVRKNDVWIPIIFLSDIFNFSIEVLDSINCIRIITNINSISAGEIIEKYTKIVVDDLKKSSNESKVPTNKSEKKVAYLTFDDGIDRKITPQILDILKENNVKATFFILGNTIEKNKDILKRMINEGHSIGNHTYSHKRDVIYTNIKSFIEEIKKTAELISNVTGIIVKIFRPPYGATYIRSQDYKDALTDYKIVLWNVDSEDSSSKDIKSKEIKENVISQIEGKKSVIILFHDNSIHAETVKALPEIIEYLQENGFTICTIDENTKLNYEY